MKLVVSSWKMEKQSCWLRVALDFQDLVTFSIHYPDGRAEMDVWILWVVSVKPASINPQTFTTSLITSNGGHLYHLITFFSSSRLQAFLFSQWRFDFTSAAPGRQSDTKTMTSVWQPIKTGLHIFVASGGQLERVKRQNTSGGHKSPVEWRQNRHGVQMAQPPPRRSGRGWDGLGVLISGSHMAHYWDDLWRRMGVKGQESGGMGGSEGRRAVFTSVTLISTCYCSSSSFLDFMI